ncbi:MAG: hypothetical protein JWL57_791 [Actinobacteria bacterium]|nr:hypothetical protein [Actinomycetota bacterium]
MRQARGRFNGGFLRTKGVLAFWSPPFPLTPPQSAP